jgi:hypothetical protein
MIDFKEYRLGMPRDGVRLSGHNPRWLPLSSSVQNGMSWPANP